MLPVPKFQVGDTVFLASTKDSQRTRACPDCNGAKEWQVTTPAGESFAIPCATCSHHSMFACGLVQDDPVIIPNVLAMTVGSVRIDTADEERPIEYMMVQTGVGSGSIYPESIVFKDESAALAAATVEAQKKNAERQANWEKNRQENKRKSARKPSWDARRVKELEAELKALKLQTA